MNNINQHAHDISHAVFRVATLIHNRKLRIELENSAIDFLANFEEALHPNSKHTATVFDKLERMISLAESTKEMKEINAQVLKRELNKLLDNLKTIATTPKTTLNDITLTDDDFIKSTNDTSDDYENNEAENMEDIINEPTETENKIDYSKILNTELTARQYSILYKIREIQTCRLRDLMASFPDISERTIRNEINELINHGLVQRIGNGGPNSYFESMEVSVPQFFN